jgi:hypothetical protein
MEPKYLLRQRAKLMPGLLFQFSHHFTILQGDVLHAAYLGLGSFPPSFLGLAHFSSSFSTMNSLSIAVSPRHARPGLPSQEAFSKHNRTFFSVIVTCPDPYSSVATSYFTTSSKTSQVRDSPF